MMYRLLCCYSNTKLFTKLLLKNWIPYLYYNCTREGRILSSRQKKYELLENMKNPSYIGQNKYENLEEPSRTSHTRSSYFLNPLVKSCQIFILIQSPSSIGQICILFQSPCQNLPDCHTFSIFSKFGRLALVNWAKLKKFQNLILKCLIPSEPERAAEARRAVVASLTKSAHRWKLNPD